MSHPLSKRAARTLITAGLTLPLALASGTAIATSNHISVGGSHAVQEERNHSFFQSHDCLDIFKRGCDELFNRHHDGRHDNHDRDCDHGGRGNGGNGGGTPSPSPSPSATPSPSPTPSATPTPTPTPGNGQVLGSSTVAPTPTPTAATIQPTVLPATGSDDLAGLATLGTASVAGALGYLVARKRSRR